MLVKECIRAILLTILEFTKYFIAYRIILGLKKSRKAWSVGIFFLLSCILQILFIIYLDSSWIGILILVLGIFIPVFFIEGTIVERIIGYLLIIPGVSIIDILSGTLLSYIYASIGYSPNRYILLDLANNMISLIVLLVFFFIGKRKKAEYIEMHSRMSVKQYLIIGSGILSCLFILAGIQIMIFNVSEMTVQGERVWLLASASASCMYIVLSIYQISTDNRAKSYKKKNEYYEEFIKFQEDYIKNIIENDQMLRSFRHDMHSHLMVIREYCNEEQYDEVVEYLDSIENYSGLHFFKKYTGNIAVDAIIGEVAKKAEENNISVIIKGTIPANYNMEMYDLCTVISNLLINAFESNLTLKKKPKIIDVEMYSYNDKLFISVKNNVDKVINIKNKEPVTSKKDKKLHGLGTYNVKRVVEKYGGSIEFTCNDNVFETQILM